MEDEKIGWSGNVVDLVASDSDSDSDSSEEQDQKQRKRQRDSSLAALGVARMPDRTNQHDVIVLDDDDEPFASTSYQKRRAVMGEKNKPIQIGHRASKYSHDDDEVVMLDQKPRARDTTMDSVEIVSVRTTPIQQILEVFPDVQVEHCESLLVEHGISRQALRHPTQAAHTGMIQTVMSQLAESSYPKTENAVAPSLCANAVRRDPVVQRTGVLQTYKHDYMSGSSFEPTQEYIRQALARLEDEFPFLAKSSIKKHLVECKHHYAIFHDNICNAILGKNKKTPPSGEATREGNTDEKQYSALTRALEGYRIPSQQVECLLLLPGITNVLKRPRCKVPPLAVTEPTLKDELAYVANKQNAWRNETMAKALRAKARQESERSGSTVECQCCFDDVAIEEMISCKEEGHLFCVDCLRRFAEEKVFGQGNLGIDKSTNSPAMELLCMYGEGCTSGFDPEHLQKALPEKVLAKYNELQYHASVDKAGLQDMCTCPKCDFQAVLPSSEIIFRCPVADCLHESCRNCGEAPHIPLRCEEVEKKNETKGRLKVEEAISAAKIRGCPKPGCRKSFVKSDGCNKMKCACGTLSCYVCRSEILPSIGYKHFCQTPHCQHKKCNKCPLYTNAEEDDARAMREAGLQAAEEVREESLAATANDTGTRNRGGALQHSDSNGVQIDVDTLLQSPRRSPAGRQQRARPARRQQRAHMG